LVTKIEKTTKQLQADNEALQKQVDELSMQLSSMSDDIEMLKSYNTRYQDFMEKLRDLLNNLFPLTKE